LLAHQLRCDTSQWKSAWDSAKGAQLIRNERFLIVHYGIDARGRAEITRVLASQGDRRLFTCIRRPHH
jgi:hypothetical protein